MSFGFILLPANHSVLCEEVNTRQPLADVNLLILILAVIVDIGGRAVLWSAAFT
jgi:hypothetical protein